MRPQIPPAFVKPARLLAALLLAVSAAALAGEADKLESARKSIARGNYGHGLKALDKVLAEKPAADVELAARTLRVEALSETGKYAEAVAEAAKAAQLALKSPDALAVHAEALMAVGKYKEARERLTKALELDKEHLEAHLLGLQLGQATGGRRAYGRHADFLFQLYNEDKAKTAAQLTAIAIAAEEDDPHGAWRTYAKAHQADKKYLDAYLHAGFHCLSKYAWQFATREFQAALKLNPSCATAHAGLAVIALRNNKYPQAKSTIDKALAINPNHPIALELQAALHTMEEQHAEARQQLEAVLAVNPHHLDALCLLAAHHEALGNTAERDKVAQRVLALNPGYADLYTTLARAGERRRQFPLAVQWARKAIALDPENWEGYYIAGMGILRIGEEREGYKILLDAFARNKFNVWAYNMLNVLEEDFKKKQFDRFDTDHFAVKLPKSQSQILGPYVRTVLEEAYERFTKKYQIEPAGPKEYGGKVLILFFPDHEQFSARTVGLPGLGALGACFGQVVTMPSPRFGRMRRGGLFNWRKVLEHEFAHVITLQKSKYRIPRWFTEGISVREEVEFPIRWQNLLAQALASNELRPLETINVGFNRPKKRTEVPTGYYYASLIVRHFEEQYGNDGILEMLALYAKGKRTPEVLAAATGKTMAQLNKDTLAYVREHAKQIKFTPAVDKKTLDALEKKVKKEDKDAAAWLEIASARLQRRKFKEARKAAEKVIALDPKQPRAHAVLGLIAMMVDKKPAEARKHFAKAKALDPDYFSPRLHLGLMALKEDKTAEAIAELEAARKVFPRFKAPGRTPHLLLADLYAKTRKPDKAIAVLRDFNRIHNDGLDSRTKLGDLLVEQGKHADAAKAYLECMFIDPFNTKVHLALAKAFEALGANGRAAQEFGIACQLERGNLAALVGRARTLVATGKKAEARRAIAAIREVDPANLDAIKLEQKLRN